VQALLCILGAYGERLDHSHQHPPTAPGSGEDQQPTTAARIQQLAFQRANLLREGKKIEVLHISFLNPDPL